MALHPNFPTSPYEILDPAVRWFPAEEALRVEGYEKLWPPLVATLRSRVKAWRDSGYKDASATSQALLRWWFQTPHIVQHAESEASEFRYYFAQREALETIIYLYDVVKVKDKYDLMRFDSSGAVAAGLLAESWRRFVVKMATGSGKTKVLSLVLAWCYFHKLYEPDSTLARNFLLITPNIIVLDRIRTDFDGLKIFCQDPILPETGYEGHNWRDDFQLTVQLQDEIGVVRKTGNLFLTNIHRVYEGNTTPPSFNDSDTTDYFLGKRPVGATNESKVDLSVIVRDVDELVILNDEAHHIHDERLAWFKSIEDIHNRLKMKGGELALQIDTTATPRHTNGAIFVQTISDYPLVEAIHQNVVKHPVLPDSASRAKLQERSSIKYTEKYADYIHLGYLEWQKVYEEHTKVGKKPVFFVMTDDTKNCDEVAAYLESTYPEFKGAVLTIHTKDNGEISEVSVGKKKEELEKLRANANSIDKFDSPYKAIVSVLMLKEGWDVKNVTTIVGLRPYAAKSNILPEQTLARGLRRRYGDGNIPEYLSVVGTDAFMDFVESIRTEGVELEFRKMGQGTKPTAPIVVEVDNENVHKDIKKLDIQIPVLTPRIYREYKNLSELNVAAFGNQKFPVREFSEEEKREIIFTDISSGQVNHITQMDSNLVANYQSVVGYFTQVLMKDLRLVSGYDVLYGKVKEFIKNYLFTKEVELEDLNILRNLSELEVSKTIQETFKKQINALTVLDRGEAEIRDYIKISQCRPFVAKDQGYIVPKKSVFNKIIGDSHFELEFAYFLEASDDVISYVKNYFAVHFRIDYRNADGAISDFYPDFFVKGSEKIVYIVETQGRAEVDDPLNIESLRLWCEDVNAIQNQVRYVPVYITQEEYEKYQPKSFSDVIKVFSLKG